MRYLQLALVFWLLWGCTSEVLILEEEKNASAEEETLLKKGPAEESSFLLAFAPFAESEKIRKMYHNFAQYLAENLGLKVRIIVAEDYESLLENLANGTFQAAFLSPVNYVKLMQRKDKEIYYGASAEIRGQSQYYGLIITHRTSGVTKLVALRNREFGFVDRNSASGFLFPYSTLLKNGLDPEKHFRRIYFLGTHSRILEALKSGRIAGGATYDGRLAELSPEERKNYLVLARTDPIPYDTFVVSKTGSFYLEKVRRLLLAIDPNTRTRNGNLVFDPQTGIGLTGFRLKERDFYNKIAIMLQTARL
ncbi:MAG: phosphate/phosphite/phosphonate ABC transporter substrate-binding protein [Leptospiraceae bacterium]|nr:phosphate/phosphite/phosphonate ABC transporter substrate-binding protein [Leptospiraceae bacterium]MDW8306767.1 phosphate/phosphite/phosphonate ABC transporter substrate-binding protein [Leptospiraceae bacterium]